MNEQRKPTAEKTKRTPLMNLGLTSYDELFTTQAEREEAKLEKIMEIPIKEISDFRDHPFKVRQDEALMEMAESIRQYGVLVPALVRPNEYGGYEMVAGHRRKLASSLAGKEVLPCIVRKLTDEEATIIMVDSNLQREQVLPSEKAFAYKMKLEALKHQGKATSPQVAAKSRTDDEIAKKEGLSGEGYLTMSGEGRNIDIVRSLEYNNFID